MMKFTLVKPAKEDLEMQPGEVDGRAYKDPVSAGAHLQICGEILGGICDSLSRVLAARGLSKEDISSKMVELVNLFVQNGDADARMKKWLEERDYTNFDWDIRSSFDKLDSENRWDSWWIIFRAARSGVTYGTQFNDAGVAKLNDREKELVTALAEARAAYWKAQEAYEKYVTDHAVMTINDLFVKYGETLSKIDKDWYDQVESRLKLQVESVLRRRQEKMAEDDTTAERPTPAE